MPLPPPIPRPRERSALRRWLGREFFILKRRWDWAFGKTDFARVEADTYMAHELIRHRSFLLRPLKDVDMRLQYNKVTNLRLAIAQLDGVVIHPGQTFSIWRLVGRPSASKGYLEGLALHNGKIATDIGGGLCQLGNLIYWMALHSPLTVKERWRHSFDVFPDINRQIPFACGATLAFNYIDLQLENNTDQSFQLSLWLDAEYLQGAIRCQKPLNLHYEIVETDHLIQQQFWGGYTRHNKIWKRITHLTDGSVTEELVAENNAVMMYNPLLSASAKA